MDVIWINPMLQIQSHEEPFNDPEIAYTAIRALIRADAMGLLSESFTRLDDSAMKELRAGMVAAGVGQSFREELTTFLHFGRDEISRLHSALKKSIEALEQSPVPDREWQSVRDVLGLELLTGLLNVSEPSARRYSSGVRNTPDAVAARLHFLALLVGDLAGTYNDIGIRRWFERPRSHLGGDTPAQALGADWSPEDDGAQCVRSLARALATFPAT